MSDDTIIFTRNYYHTVDPGDYYKDGIVKATKALPIRPVYVSDLIDNADCRVNFGSYRNKDNKDNAQINIKDRYGIIHSYNPETKLLEVISEKKNPRLKSFNKKKRYVIPENATVILAHHSSGPPNYRAIQCTLNRTDCEKKADCIKQLKNSVKSFNEQKAQFLKLDKSIVEPIKGAGRHSRRHNKNKQVRTSIRCRF